MQGCQALRHSDYGLTDAFLMQVNMQVKYSAQSQAHKKHNKSQQSQLVTVNIYKAISCVRHSSKCFYMYYPILFSTTDETNIIVSILQMKKLRFSNLLRTTQLGRVDLGAKADLLINVTLYCSHHYYDYYCYSSYHHYYYQCICPMYT